MKFPEPNVIIKLSNLNIVETGFSEMQGTEFAIELLFDQRRDGRFHVHSPNVPGFHLAGRDLQEIREDLEPVLKDLLYHNSNVIVDQIRWVPSLEDVVKRMEGTAPPPEPKPGKPTFLVILGHAA